MNEKNFSGEKETDVPMLLDIVNLDGRWAQCLSARVVKYLDTGDAGDIDWSNWELTEKIDSGVGNFMQKNPNIIDPAEIEKIFYHDARQNKDIGSKMSVTVFGKFRSKESV